jgi:hypothetical protein
MTVWAWIPIIMIVLGSLASIASIGEERKPLTPPVAVLVIIINAFLIYCIFRAATG